MRLCDARALVAVRARIVFKGAEGAVERFHFLRGRRERVCLPLGGTATDEFDVDLVAFRRFVGWGAT